MKRIAKILPKNTLLPFVDVMFLTLASFMYGMHMMSVHYGISLKLPSSQTSSVQDKQEIVISIDPEGQIYLNRLLMPPEGLIPALKNVLAGDPERSIFIQGDRRAPYETVISVLDRLRKNKIKKISLQTNYKNEKP